MNLTSLRKDFPILEKNIHYFDSACMSLKPLQVIEAMQDYYCNYPACVGRSNHDLARTTEEKIQQTREQLQKFINATHSKEIIFTR
ncbi:MAG: aminotransferase class V-fold PLP-dependent enzyme, partial [Nanoarchaeota archaeon]|nr:aminotransferase class V-fold PLP-dependent enzyme [Nanoarchaeota archaeon]